MAWLYDILIHFLLFLSKIVALFHPKTKKWIEGQELEIRSQEVRSQEVRSQEVRSQEIRSQEVRSQEVRNQESGIGNPKSQIPNPKCIWFHAASLGEFEQGRPVIETVRKTYPDWKIVLTFFSPSGYEIRKNYEYADLVCYLPADTKANVCKLLDTIRPDIVLFIKYEFWFNYLTELKRRQIPTILFSAIFRPNQPFFKWYGGFHRQMLFCFNHILVQNQQSSNLLQSIGFQDVEVSGDTRLDRVLEISKNVKSLPEIETFKGNSPLLIVGSAWPDDMAVLIPFINRFDKPLKVIVAPHQIDQKQIQTWQGQLADESSLFSNIKPSKILFIDSIGLLSSLYQYADFAFIGGAYGDGLHNILEPAAFGMPIFFGDKFYDKFQEAHDLIAQGAVFPVADTQSFNEKFIAIYQNQKLKEQAAQTTSQYVLNHSGATQCVMSKIANVVEV